MLELLKKIPVPAMKIFSRSYSCPIRTTDHALPPAIRGVPT
jgi:hypothetical protein